MRREQNGQDFSINVAKGSFSRTLGDPFKALTPA